MDGKRSVRYYTSYETDFFAAAKDYSLPHDYKWVRNDLFSRIASVLIYSAAIIFSNIYCRLFLHVRIKGSDKIRSIKGTGFFVYGNHTQPVGDVFNPALVCFPKRIYTIASTANYTLPVIGKILPYLGALPVPDTLSGMKKFENAIEYRLKQNSPIIIYPEAHVWEYYTGIRPFSATSFKFPLKYDSPVFSMTTTYQRRLSGKKPRITIYIDGPFSADGATGKEKAQSLCDNVYQSMLIRSKESNYNYIEYVLKSDENT